MSISHREAKITIAKLVELAYSENKGLTTKILIKKGPVKLTIDQNGDVRLFGSAGIVTFSGSPVLDKIGITIKSLSINFNNQGGMKVGYTATINLKIITVTVVGDFDIEELITSCSGLLCKAAKLLKGRHDAYEMELQRIMGN